MPGIYQEQFQRPYTHIRVLAARMSPGGPAILELCRAEVVLDDERIWHDAPHTLSLGTTADEGETPLRWRSTPLLLAQTVWTPGPPHVVASHDPAIWALLSGPILGHVARLDVRRLVRQGWPDAPVGDLAALLDHLGMTGMVERVPTRPPGSALQLEVRRCMTLLTTLHAVHGELLVLLRSAALGTPPAWVTEVLGQQAPDPRLQAMVDLAALPLDIGAASLPDLQASDAAWAELPIDQLIWAADQENLPRALRQRTEAELVRRLREQGRIRTPGLILRRIGKLARI